MIYPIAGNDEEAESSLWQPSRVHSSGQPPANTSVRCMQSSRWPDLTYFDGGMIQQEAAGFRGKVGEVEGEK